MNLVKTRVPRIGSAFALAALTIALHGTLAQGDEPPDLAASLAAARPLETEDLCEPVNSVRQGMLLWAPNPDGRSWDLLQIYFPKYGGPNTIVVIDLGSGEVKTVSTERGWNFHLCPSVIAPNGKLFISALNSRLQQKICVYDPATNELQLDAVAMPEEILGETHPLVLGTDGMLYAIGQHPSRSATAVQIHPDTLQATFYGPIGPSHAPNACWGYSGAADDRFVYIASGKIPWYLVAYDRQTGESKTLVETGSVGGYVSVGQRPDGCTGSASGIVGTDGTRVNYWLHEGRAIPVDDSQRNQPPWPARPASPPLPPRPEVNAGLAVPDVEGWAEIWVRTAEAKSAAAAEPPDAAPEQLGWQRFRFQVPLYPHDIYRLTELPDGRLFGTAGSYEGNFVYDPRTGQHQHLGKTELSHYATAISGGKVYMSGYPSSPVYQYDPGAPWTAGTFVANRVVPDQDARANPRRLTYLGDKERAGTHKMYAAGTAADGTVFFGGSWIRDGACGGLGWYDPQTDTAGGIWQPLSNLQVTHLAMAEGGRTVVLSTRRVDDPVLNKPKPAQGALVLLDAASKEIKSQFEPVPGAKGAGPIVAVGERRIVGWTENPENERASILYAFDVIDQRLIYRHDVPVPLPVAIGSNQQEAWDFRLGPDGRIWTFAGNTLLQIDPEQGHFHVVGRLNRGGRLAFAEGRVYLGGATALRRIRN
jgi:hypothetical protein